MYKLIYMSNYICPNIVMKTLQECYQIPLYIDADVSIKPNWLNSQMQMKNTQ
jgi:hypothetical protein